MSDEQLERFAQFVEVEPTPQWSVIVKQGEHGDAMYLILEGELRVEKLVFTDQTSAPNLPQAHNEPVPRVLDWKITIRPNSLAILHL